MLGRPKTVVKEFKTRRQMQRVVARMAGRGYQVAHQSGEFSHNPFVLRWNRRRVVVTFEANTAKAAAVPEGTDGG